MGWLGSGLTFPVSCLILVWAVGSGSVRVRHPPTCFSDYISTSTCEWGMGGPTNCSAELRLTYQLDFLIFESRTCVPENRESTVCLCNMLMDDMVSVDTYQLDLWAGKQRLWNGSFKPSEHVKPRAPGNLSVASSVSHMWQLTWSNPYPPDSLLCNQLSYQVNISNEDDPSEALGIPICFALPRPGLSLPIRVVQGLRRAVPCVRDPGWPALGGQAQAPDVRSSMSASMAAAALLAKPGRWWC